MDKPRIYRPKWPLKPLGALMMVAGLCLCLFFLDRPPYAAYAAHVGMSLLVVGATFLADAFR